MSESNLTVRATPIWRLISLDDHASSAVLVGQMVSIQPQTSYQEGRFVFGIFGNHIWEVFEPPRGVQCNQDDGMKMPYKQIQNVRLRLRPFGTREKGAGVVQGGLPRSPRGSM